jgi:hypothetical protein
MSSRQNDAPGRPGNAKPFTVSLSKKTTENKPPFKSQLPPPSRGPKGFHNRNLYQDFSDEEEEEQPAHQEVVGFDSTAGGAISKHAAVEAKAPLVIQVQSKNNWRDRPGVNRKGKNLLPQEVQAAGAGAAVVETEGPSISYGLSLAPSREGDIDHVAEERKDADMPDADGDAPTPQKPEPIGQDELALQALISESQGNNDRKRSDLVIESSSKGEGRYDETSSFRTDVATRPDQASLDAYNAVPVEEFGAALLRGMGWKEGQTLGRGRYDGSSSTAAAAKASVPERRPGFLGIGAKDTSGGKGAETEIGAWGKSAMRKGSRKNGDNSGNTEGVYMPIVMKNKSTGEHLTEEEFKTLQLGAKNHVAPTNGRGDRERRHRYDDEGESSTRDRRRERSKDSSSRRYRDRSRSSGAYDRRSRRYDDDKGSEREQRRYRDRSDRDRSDRDYKDRSSRKDDYKSSRRERDSTRDDDRDRDRDRHHRSGRDRRDGDSGRDRDKYKDSSRRR